MTYWHLQNYQNFEIRKSTILTTILLKYFQHVLNILVQKQFED